MAILNKQSLADTIDGVNAAVFSGRKIPVPQKRSIAKWLAGRQGLEGSYAGMIAPTTSDRRGGFRVFTGESVVSGAGGRHILGQEGCRALISMGVKTKEVSNALERAWVVMGERLRRANEPTGSFCCATCTIALWRHLSAGGLFDPEKQLAGGLRYLKLHRMDSGRWRRFPFYYTLYTMLGIDVRGVKAEFQFAAPACERALKHLRGKNEYTLRCREVLERALARA